MDRKQARPLAVVTGASSGIGYELAVQFAQHGYDLLIVSGSDAIEQAADDLEALGARVRTFQANLATRRGVEAFHRAIVATRRPVAAIAINAGVGVGGKFWETDLDEEINLLNLNVLSTVHLAKLVIQDMIDEGEGGKILFTSSTAAIMPGPNEAVYAASKAFIQSFAMAMRHELKEKGITVTALQPGATDTNFFSRAGMDDTKAGAMEKEDPADVAKQGYEALMEDKEAIITGSVKTRTQNAANDLAPEQTKAKAPADGKPGSAGGKKEKKEDVA